MIAHWRESDQRNRLMYRIRLTDGRELEFPSIQEFSAAVQDGTVDGDASIFHRRAERWLPVREHPHYLQARAHAPTRPPAAPAAGGVDLDAILSLLDGATGGAAAAPPSPPAAGSSSPPAPDLHPVMESVDDLPVLRTGFEPEESAEAEAAPDPESEAAGDLPDATPLSESVHRVADDIEEAPAEPLPVEALAPDDEPGPAPPAAPPASVAPTEPARDAFWSRPPEPAMAKLELDPLGGDFGA
ncbi:MAG TPA: hypothetical protein VJ773_02580, partial [Gemmatimonadales bacterium]|nr:hypothetical protein [Gemmatimonadales bacterium]